jgi:ABC-type metal ion transport system substrate-binding protein
LRNCSGPSRPSPWASACPRRLAAEPLKIGTTAAFAIPLEAAVEEAGKQGLEVKLVEFTDWIAPNVSLAAATST